MLRGGCTYFVRKTMAMGMVVVVVGVTAVLVKGSGGATEFEAFAR
jgi:hypothetical protein